MCRSLRFAPVAKRSSGSIYWDHVLVDGASEHHPEGKYYIEWYEEEGRRRKSVGTIPCDVLAAAQRKRAELNAKDAGIAPAKTESAPAQRLLAGDAVERYLRDVNMNKAESTFTHYRHSLTLFKQSLTKATVDAIDPDDMMDFQAFLYKQGLSARTVKLILLTPSRKYNGPQEFAYPAGVRIAGRIRMFALGLPLPDYPLLRSLPSSQHSAPLILPWEHTSMDRLARAKHRRFRRSRQDLHFIREAMEAVFHTRLSGRTERRYRRPTTSLPHVDALIQLTMTHLAPERVVRGKVS